MAIPYPGEATQDNLPPCHSVQIKLEACEFEEARHESKKEHKKKFEKKESWISFVFPNHVLARLETNVV